MQVKALSEGGKRRSLKWQAEQLDGFRRGWQRGACAHDASKVQDCVALFCLCDPRVDTPGAGRALPSYAICSTQTCALWHAKGRAPFGRLSGQKDPLGGHHTAR